MAPMAMAMPPRLMMLEVRPMLHIASRAIKMASGNVSTATSALRKWNRNTMQTRLTMMLSSISFSRRVSTACSISWERS